VVNPLLAFWRRLLGDDDRPVRSRARRMPHASATQASETIFLVLRRMRTPLIVLIVIFAVSVLGLKLIPGQDAQGQPARMGFFDAFYIMSYTASTIGFGEIPHPFTYAQRMWVTVTIFLAVTHGKHYGEEYWSFVNGQHTICIPNTVAIIHGTQHLDDARKLADFLLSAQTELALARSASRQIPLGSLTEQQKAQLPEQVRALLPAAAQAYPLTHLLSARNACLAWLKTQYLK